MGKGWHQRPCNKDKYDKNYLRIFGIKCWACNGEGKLQAIGCLPKSDLTCIVCNGIGYYPKSKGLMNGC